MTGAAHRGQSSGTGGDCGGDRRRSCLDRRAASAPARGAAHTRRGRQRLAAPRWQRVAHHSSGSTALIVGRKQTPATKAHVSGPQCLRDITGVSPRLDRRWEGGTLHRRVGWRPHSLRWAHPLHPKHHRRQPLVHPRDTGLHACAASPPPPARAGSSLSRRGGRSQRSHRTGQGRS
jgi:hypothetical protein